MKLWACYSHPIGSSNNTELPNPSVNAHKAQATPAEHQTINKPLKARQPKPLPRPRISRPRSETTPMAKRPPAPLPRKLSGPPCTTTVPLPDISECPPSISVTQPTAFPPSVMPTPFTKQQQLTLKELEEKYANNFPLCIRVVEGYSGATAQHTISNGDVYNIHFMKHQKVVTIRDSHGCPYSIPLNSSVQFGIVYDPDNEQGYDGEVKTHTFRKVADIMAAKIFPRVVCATKAFKGSGSKSSVEEKEILLVHQVLKSRLRGKKCLEVFSLHTQSEKVLHADCEGCFSTKPGLIKLYLPEIVQHVPNAFPCQAILFLGTEFTSSLQHFPSSLLSNHVTMIETKQETSLIASVVDPSNPKSELSEAPLLDIPIDGALSEVKVSVIQSDDAKKLNDDTQNIFRNFNISKLVSYKDTGSEKTNCSQRLFYSTLHHGCENYGIDLDAPPTFSPSNESLVQSVGEPVFSRESVLYETLPNEMFSPEEKADVFLPSWFHNEPTMYNSAGMLDGQYDYPRQQPAQTPSHTQHQFSLPHPSPNFRTIMPYATLPHSRSQSPLPPIPPDYVSMKPAYSEQLEMYGEIQSPSHNTMYTSPPKHSQSWSNESRGIGCTLPMRANPSDYNQLFDEMMDLKTSLAVITKRMETIEKRVDDLALSQGAQTNSKHTEVRDKQLSVEENMTYLCSLDPSQVGHTRMLSAFFRVLL